MLPFEEIVEKAKKFGNRATHKESLEFYSYYKQATVGDYNTEEPDDPTDKAKWQAWKEKKGITIEEAKTYYVKVYEKYAPKYEET